MICDQYRTPTVLTCLAAFRSPRGWSEIRRTSSIFYWTTERICRANRYLISLPTAPPPPPDVLRRGSTSRHCQFGGFRSTAFPLRCRRLAPQSSDAWYRPGRIQRQKDRRAPTPPRRQSTKTHQRASICNASMNRADWLLWMTSDRAEKNIHYKQASCTIWLDTLCDGLFTTNTMGHLRLCFRLDSVLNPVLHEISV